MKKLKQIYLMALTVIKRVIAVLDMPGDIDDFITFANGIHDSMVASPFFAGLAAKLALLRTHIQTLTDMHNGLQTNPPTTTTAQRNAALIIVENDLRGLRGDVQVIADADTPNAVTIIEAAGMKVKKQGAINKDDFDADNGEISGTVMLTAKGIENQRSAHDWAMSTVANQWNSLTPTIQAHTLVDGLTRGTIVSFRHREILPTGPGDWSDPIEVVVQ